MSVASAGGHMWQPILFVGSHAQVRPTDCHLKPCPICGLPCLRLPADDSNLELEVTCASKGHRSCRALPAWLHPLTSCS